MAAGSRAPAPAAAQSMHKKGSIAASLFWLSAGWLIVALVATAFLLTELYSRALDNDLSRSLDFTIETLTDQVLSRASASDDAINANATYVEGTP